MSMSFNYYAVLGLKPEASSKDVKVAYKLLARQFHPDKLRLRAKTEGKVSSEVLHAAISIEEMFAAVSTAYETLKDPLRKAQYDYEQGYVQSADAIQELHKADAEKAVDLMRLTFDIKRRTEFARQGLIIDDANYGSILDATKRINVTRPLQCMVQGSRLVIPRGDPKHLLIGFYDPSPKDAKMLSIKYFFRGRLHEIIIPDTGKLLMPLKSHLIKRGRSSSENNQLAATATAKALARKERNAQLARISLSLAVCSGALAVIAVAFASHQHRTRNQHHRSY